MSRNKTSKHRSGGAQDINPAPYPAAVMVEGRQPSNAIMEWATTAGIPAPLKMANVAHGGKRSTKRRTHHKRHGKRSMKRHTKRTRKHRGGSCGPCAAGMIRP